MKPSMLSIRCGVLALALICTGLPAHDAAAQAGPPARTITLNVGDDAPPLAVERWIKGEPIPSFRKGHVYVLDFWATWCVPCRQGMPHMSELAKKYKGKATFIAMNVSEPVRPDRDTFTLVNSFVRMMGDKMDLHVAMDTDARAVNTAWLKAAGLGSLPSVIIVDRAGKIAWMGQSRGVDDAVAAIVAGTFDSKAFATARAARLDSPRGNSAAMAEAAPIRRAIAAKDYPLAVSLYEKAVASNPAAAETLMGTYYPALAHVDPGKAYRLAVEARGSEREYGLARALSEQPGLEKRFYDYVADYFTRRAEFDFFAMGYVAKAHFLAGDIAKAITVQRQFVAHVKLPTTPSTEGYIKREEETLGKYEAAAKPSSVR